MRSIIPNLKERGGERRRATFGEVVIARDDERCLHEPGAQDAPRT